MKRLQITLTCVAALGLLTVACGPSQTDSGGGDTATSKSDDAIPPKAAKAAKIAAAIQAAPDNADAILKEHGMTTDSFRELMFEIAEDPALSEAYERARGK